MKEAITVTLATEQAVSTALKQQMPQLLYSINSAVEAATLQLQQQLTDGIVAQLQPLLDTLPGNDTMALLRRSVSEIRAVSGQGEILAALIDGAARFSGRCGLMIVRGAFLVGWQGRGLDIEHFRRLQIDARHGLAEEAMRRREVVSGKVSALDPHFAANFGAPLDGCACLFPLLVHEHAAALLYADAGDSEDSHPVNADAISILVDTTTMWLERTSILHTAPQPAVQATANPQAQVPAPSAPAFAPQPVVESVAPQVEGPSYAQHLPEPPVPPKEEPAAQPAPDEEDEPRFFSIRAAEPAIPQTAETAAPHKVEAIWSAPVTTQTQEAYPARPVPESPAPTPAAVAPPQPVTAPVAESAVSSEMRNKARRFAKLLVDEIKLYKGPLVERGRMECNIYTLLHEDIDKSRTTYQRRFGELVPDVDYFREEMLRILADGDITKMGTEFPG